MEANVALVCERVRETLRTCTDALAAVRATEEEATLISALPAAAAAVESARDVCAMVRAALVDASQAKKLGLEAKYVEICFARDSAWFKEADATLQHGAAKLGKFATLQHLQETEVEQIVKLVESVGCTSYKVPGDQIPNWVNVKCGLQIVEDWVKLAGKQTELISKLRLVQNRVFNSSALRRPSQELLDATAQNRLKFGYLIGKAFVEEKADELAFVTYLELGQTTLHFILSRLCWRYQLLVVEGDGNCFFRAVVKCLAPHVPRDFEDHLSLRLRKLINAQPKEGLLAEFEVSEESDSHTMSAAGVWADHIQIAKVAHFLSAPVFLVRCDDEGLQLDAQEGLLLPSELYRIGEAVAAPPLVLFYQTAPGHFESLVCEREAEAAPSSLLAVVDVLFRLEGEQAQAAQLALAAAKSFPSEPEMRRAAQEESKGRLEEFAASVRSFRAHLASLSPQKLLLQPGAGLFGELLVELLVDSGHACWCEGRRECGTCVRGSGGTGPLTQLLLRLQPFHPSLLEKYGALPIAPLPPPVLPPVPAPVLSPVLASSSDNLFVRGSVADASAFAQLLQREEGSPRLVAIRDTDVCAVALQKLLAAVEAFPRLAVLSGGVAPKVSFHLQLERCQLDEAVCELLKQRPPRLLTLIYIKGCQYPPAFQIWFTVRQHITLEK